LGGEQHDERQGSETNDTDEFRVHASPPWGAGIARHSR
jgi:hypothetical protein